jgi:hypothetical protein
MITMGRNLALLLVGILLGPGAHRADISVMLSGALTAAFNELMPQFE